MATDTLADLFKTSQSPRQAMFKALLEQGMNTSPIQSPTQGLSRMAFALLAGLDARDEDQRDKLTQVAPNQLSDVLGGGAAPTGGQAPMPNTAPQKIYSNNEPSPLDPPSGIDRDRLIRVMHAEAGNQGPQGQQAVANVVRNRAVSGQYGGDTVAGVLAKPYAFEPTMTAAGQQRMASLGRDSPEYTRYSQAIDRAYKGDDPTGGATHFYSPQGQAALGRQPPAWGTGQPQARIGGHDFFSPDQPRQQVAQAGPPQQNAPALQRLQEAAKSHPNPVVRREAQQLLLQQQAKQLEPDKWEMKQTGQDKFGNPVYSHVNSRGQLIPAAGTGSSGPEFKDVQSVRKEIQDLPSYKNIAQSAPVYKSMVEAAGRDNRAADVNLIYGMAKLMDPGSVVRESEMTVAQAIATLPQQLRATIESQLTGTGRLSPEVRAALMQEAHSRVNAYQGMFDQDATMYRVIAQTRQMDEREIIPKFGPFEQYKPTQTEAPATAMTAVPQGPPKAGTVLDGYRFKGGDPGKKENWEKVK